MGSGADLSVGCVEIKLLLRKKLVFHRNSLNAWDISWRLHLASPKSRCILCMKEIWIELGTQTQESTSKEYETISKVLNCRWPRKGRCKCMTLHMNNHEYGWNIIE